MDNLLGLKARIANLGTATAGLTMVKVTRFAMLTADDIAMVYRVAKVASVQAEALAVCPQSLILQADYESKSKISFTERELQHED